MSVQPELVSFRNLEGVDVSVITEAFNESFADYFVPMKLTPERLMAKMHAENTSLKYSVGAFFQDRLVGFILHAMDMYKGQKLLYNGGTGVIPAYRGSQLTTQMYQYIRPILQDDAVEGIVLEVIDRNLPAIKSYQRVGFHHKRSLQCFSGSLIDLSSSPESWDIYPMETYDWELMQSFWDITPSWQNSQYVADRIHQTLFALGAYQSGRLIGYLLYNPLSKRIVQLAVAKEYRRRSVATQMVIALSQQYGKALDVINVCEDSSESISFLTSIGLQYTLTQMELYCPL